MPVAPLLRPAVAAAAALLGVVAYRVQIEGLHSPPARATAIVAVAWAFVVAGLVASSRRPGNRLGALMVLAGFALLARQLRYSHDALAFTAFYLLGNIGYVLVAHSALAYPSGQVTDRVERILLRIGYVVALGFPFAILLLHGAHDRLLGFDSYPRRSLLLVESHARLQLDLQKAFIAVLYGVLGLLLFVVIVRRLVLGTPRMRRTLGPLLLAGIAIAARAVIESVLTFFDRTVASDYVFWWQIGAFVALPLALLGGLLRARLAQATVGDLVVELERTPPEGIRAALARALGDPTLEIAFWLPERQAFVDAAGQPVELPAEGSQRAVTQLDRDGEPLAALVHDRSLLDERRLIDSAGAAARMALENARLQAELRAQLKEVQDSRRRIVTVADDERRRIERDLHDGAQQRLVAVALQLRNAQRQAVDPELNRLLAAGVAELQAAVAELRELAQGVRPAVLTEQGLGAALEAVASRAPLPVSIHVLEGRLPPEIEAAAYFVACEALANTVKHAGASTAELSAQRHDGVLVVEVADDGVGGARTDAGSGLRGLADRVEALGGRLRVESPPGRGTRVTGEIPCAS